MLDHLLDSLTTRARALALTDAEWARRAGLRKETLSRLRRRQDCDLSTLQALAREVGASLALQDAPTPAPTGFPTRMDRGHEGQLVALAAAGPGPLADWRAAGSADFMAGLAVLMADGPERPRWLALAEQLQPGATRPQAFQAWLERSPLAPARFLPMVAQAQRRHG